ncbi:MAG: DinB family protein [Thermomicrobiales bacterium]
MDPICTAAQIKFREQEQGFLTVLSGLPDDALNWRPGAETNSIAVLVAHTWGAAQAWTARASGTEIERDRDAEFRVVLSGAECDALIRSAGVRVASFVAAIDPATYGDDRVDANGDHITVAMCLIHAVEHTQEHYAHACLTRQLWEQRKP